MHCVSTNISKDVSTDKTLVTTGKFQNKYRISSTRLQHWDYSQAATYFITICTKNRIPYFGHIQDDVIILSDIGKIVENQWIKTFDMRPDMNLQMGEYIVMSNHFHAIISIGENQYNNHGETRRDAMHCVSTNTTNTTVDMVNADINQFGPQSKNLASVIRGFKIGVTVNARKIRSDFAWQSRFYEHIIRNEKSFYRISNYIINNPLHWQKDD